MKSLLKSRRAMARLNAPGGETKKKYRLSDLFCYFYLHHVKKNAGNKTYWQNNYNSSAMNIRLGLAFEEVVFSHIDQIKHSLGISGVVTRESSWSVEGDNENPEMQIELVIDRDDRVINICEIKFCRREYSVGSGYARKIEERIEKVREFSHGKAEWEPAQHAERICNFSRIA